MAEPNHGRSNLIAAGVVFVTAIVIYFVPYIWLLAFPLLGLAFVFLIVGAIYWGSPGAPKVEHVEKPSGTSNFGTEVVGESNYLDNLIRMCGKRTPDGVNMDFKAHLVPEPENPHDKLAVRVDINGLTVGYLSREDARKHRKRLVREGFGIVAVECDANVRGGWYRSKSDQGHFGVKLDI